MMQWYSETSLPTFDHDHRWAGITLPVGSTNNLTGFPSEKNIDGKKGIT